jgi:hypothetical protein
MAGLAAILDGGRDRARTVAFVAGSLALHGAALLFLSLRAPNPAEPGPPPARLLYVDIEPRPLLAGEAVRTPPRPVETDDTAPATAAAEPTPRPRDEDEDEDAPTTPSPRLVRPAPAGAPPAPADPWRYRPESPGDAVRRTMRTGIPGCSSLGANLTAAERALCDQRFNAAAARAAPIAGTNNPERDARFAREGARALADYEARRRPLSGGVGVLGVQEGVGSNFGVGVAGAHLDPSLRPESAQNVRTRRDGPVASGRPLTPGASNPRE